MLNYRDMKKGFGCNSCTHPTCVHSVNSLGVSSCVKCEAGVLVLDPSAAPKWKLGCNRYIIIVLRIFKFVWPHYKNLFIKVISIFHECILIFKHISGQY